MLSAQRSAGNQAVVSLLQQGRAQDGSQPLTLQRWGETKTDRQRIDAALVSKDPADVKAIDDVNVATSDEKFKLIRILAYQGWVGPRDEGQIEALWRSFGDRMPELAGPEIVLWQHCIDVGAELEKLAPYKRAQTAFMSDVQHLALSYLDKNQAFVDADLKSLGVGQAPSAAADQKLAEVQEMARLVRDARAKERGLRNLRVGDFLELPDDGLPHWRPLTFDPEQQPDRNLDDNAADKLRDWNKVHAVWKPVADAITTTANTYPSIYATIAQSEPGATIDKTSMLAVATPAAARVLIGESLRTVLDNIAKARPKIAGNDPDYRDMLPLHAALFNGSSAGASGTDWKQSFYRQVAKNDLADHETRQFWIRLGLTTAAAAAFVVAEFATAGTATFFLAAGVGLAASGYQAYGSLDRYMALDAAAKATVKDDAAIVDHATVLAAQQQAIQDAASFIQSAATLGIRAATAPVRTPAAAGGGGGGGAGAPTGGGGPPGAGPTAVPGRVQSRINVANGPTRFTPLKGNGNPAQAGWDHVQAGHFGGGNSQSQFTQPPGRVKALLQSPTVVGSQARPIGTGASVSYIRTVDVAGELGAGQALGTIRQGAGGSSTTWMRVQTDAAGNLITCYPVPKP